MIELDATQGHESESSNRNETSVMFSGGFCIVEVASAGTILDGSVLGNADSEAVADAASPSVVDEAVSPETVALSTAVVLLKLTVVEGVLPLLVTRAAEGTQSYAVLVFDCVDMVEFAASDIDDDETGADVTVELLTEATAVALRADETSVALSGNEDEKAVSDGISAEPVALPVIVAVALRSPEDEVALAKEDDEEEAGSVSFAVDAGSVSFAVDVAGLIEVLIGLNADDDDDEESGSVSLRAPLLLMPALSLANDGADDDATVSLADDAVAPTSIEVELVSSAMTLEAAPELALDATGEPVVSSDSMADDVSVDASDSSAPSGTLEGAEADASSVEALPALLLLLLLPEPPPRTAEISPTMPEIAASCDGGADELAAVVVVVAAAGAGAVSVVPAAAAAEDAAADEDAS